MHTVQGERVMRPGFGSNVVDYIFAAAVHSHDASIAYEVREQLLRQEPRIVDVEVACREVNRLSGASWSRSAIRCAAPTIAITVFIRFI